MEINKAMKQSDQLKGCPLLAGIPAEDLRRDCRTARIVAIQHRGTIYQFGDPAKTVYCVPEGRVALAGISPHGTALTTGVLAAGNFFGPVLSGAAEAEDTASAIGVVSLWQVPIDECQRLLLHHPGLALECVSLLAQRQRRTERRLEASRSNEPKHGSLKSSASYQEALPPAASTVLGHIFA